ncbi:hypothetical protein B9Z65_1436 [Elsinoe australis]|uniref:Uncharacterized protein n=1 Tax=Elsinoe australis TaxID=40998 RepID=A0A2P7YFV6_9PEZI|nr:hypothetical protein B9Z65_1436 [Elsinoe australis]
MSSLTFSTDDPACQLSDLAPTLSDPASKADTDDLSSPAPSPMSSDDSGEFVKTVGFADLTPEVRHRIYKLTPHFKTEDGCKLTCYFEFVGNLGDTMIYKWSRSWPTGTKSALLNLAKTCRLTYDEALKYAYKEVNFVFEQDTLRIGSDVLRMMAVEFPKSLRIDLAKSVVLNFQVSVRRTELRIVERLLEDLYWGEHLEKFAIRMMIGGFDTTDPRLEESFLDVLRSLRTHSKIGIKLFGSDRETKKRLKRRYIREDSDTHD